MPLRAIAVVGAIIAVGCVTRATPEQIAAFPAWLGPQRYPEGSLLDIMSRESRAPSERLHRYRIGLAVMRASDVELPGSRNAPITFDGSRFVSVDGSSLPTWGDRLVLVGGLTLEGETGWRFYTLDVRITGGPLEGALVHLRDGHNQAVIEDPCFALYPLPSDLASPVGPVPFEVVAVQAK